MATNNALAMERDITFYSNRIKQELDERIAINNIHLMAYLDKSKKIIRKL